MPPKARPATKREKSDSSRDTLEPPHKFARLVESFTRQDATQGPHAMKCSNDLHPDEVKGCYRILDQAVKAHSSAFQPTAEALEKFLDVVFSRWTTASAVESRSTTINNYLFPTFHYSGVTTKVGFVSDDRGDIPIVQFMELSFSPPVIIWELRYDTKPTRVPGGAINRAFEWRVATAKELTLMRWEPREQVESARDGALKAYMKEIIKETEAFNKDHAVNHARSFLKRRSLGDSDHCVQSRLAFFQLQRVMSSLPPLDSFMTPQMYTPDIFGPAKRG